jgi:hypothetical protein
MILIVTEKIDENFTSGSDYAANVKMAKVLLYRTRFHCPWATSAAGNGR